ncbi:hypothetical protein GGX14DRAFT_399455 [Mycena pura]|uniref:Uncharacterized protein n=1 Tax=Mycena pura TaxID=153505 RepID=A0AAD6V4R6_9AGAR|nr:hypothetical protein GGX14DRAFT_399455 [Mycena pura]
MTLMAQVASMHLQLEPLQAFFHLEELFTLVSLALTILSSAVANTTLSEKAEISQYGKISASGRVQRQRSVLNLNAERGAQLGPGQVWTDFRTELSEHGREKTIESEIVPGTFANLRGTRPEEVRIRRDSAKMVAIDVDVVEIHMGRGLETILSTLTGMSYSDILVEYQPNICVKLYS